MSAPAPVRVFLSGEGSNELGSHADHLSYRTEHDLGVLHALLKKVEPSGWTVGGARVWKNIRKYRAMPSAKHLDTHNVLALANDAIEAKCDILAFSRDVDKDPEREDAIEDGIALIPKTFANAPAVIGGVADPSLEAWILALLGHPGSEARNAEATLAAKGIARKDGAAMAEAVAEADLSRIPPDAASLLTWLKRAQDVLPAHIAKNTAG